MTYILQQYASDTFTTGGRGTPNAWSPSSDSNADNWVQQTGTATPSIVTAAGQLRGQLTGDNSANVWYLGSNQFLDVDQYVRIDVSNTAVKPGLISRSTGGTTYYRADVTGSTLEIVLNNGGTSTTLASMAVSFAASTYYWLHFRTQGFGAAGSNPNNLLVNFWADPNSGSGNSPTGEPAGWMLTASDGTLTKPGNFGLFYKANTTGQSATYDSYTCTDCPPPANTPAYNSLQAGPYGITYFVASTPPPLPTQFITDMVGPNSASATGWKNGSSPGLRWQLQWAVIESVQGFYDWGKLDDAVQKANYNGIRMVFTFDNPPTWRLTLDAFGSNAVLSGTYSNGTNYTTLNLQSALPAGAYIPHGYQITVGAWGTSATPENLYVWNPGHTYGAGTTSIGISTSQTAQVAWNPAATHSTGEAVREKTQAAGQFASASDMAAFASLVAQRYNGLAGFGLIEVFQVGNENYDIQQRVQGQGAYNTSGGSPPTWDQSSSWDNGGAILAPTYVAVRNAIQAIPGHASTPVFSNAVRKTPTTGRTHIINWMTGFVSSVLAAGGGIDGVDFHYYRNSSTTINPDGTTSLVQDPTLSTYSDVNQTQINTPSIALEIADLKAIFAANAINPEIANWECGWDIYDDGGGALTTLTSSITAGASVSSLSVSSTYTHASVIADATPISIDYNNTSITEIVYAYGSQAKNATTLQVTTNPGGSNNGANVQVPLVAANNHSTAASVYAAVTTTPVTPALQAQYHQAMYDALRTAGCSYCFIFTDNPPQSTVTTSVDPQTSQNTKGITQTISGTYTYEPAYSMTASYSAQYPTWLPASAINPPLLITIGSYTIGAAGGTLYFLEDSWQIKYILAQRWQATFTVIDETGTVFFHYRDRVVIKDATLGVLFTGFVADDTYDMQSTYPSGGIEHRITVMDLRGLFDKRTSNLTYVTPTVAGKIVTDMVDQVLDSEGVIAHYATQTTTTQSDWNTGTLTNVTASGAVGDGDLELLPASGSMTTSILAQGDWAANGTLSAVQANSGGDLSLNGATRNWDNGIKSNQTLYGNGSPSQSINSQGNLVLSCTAASETRARMDWAGQWQDSTITVDMYLGGTNSLNSLVYRTTGWTNDDQTYAYAIEANLGVLQLKIGSNGGAQVSETLASHTFSPSMAAGWYTIAVTTTTSGGHVRHQISVNGTQYIDFTQTAPSTGNNYGPYTNSGYIGLRNRNLDPFTTTELFDNFGVMAAKTGTWTSSSQSLSGITTIANSVIEWDTSLSAGGTISVKASTDGGATYQSCSSGGVIPGLTKGASGSGKNLIILVTLSTTSAAIMPDIQHLSWSVAAGYVSSGNRVSGPFSLSGVGQCGSTFIGWNANVPPNTSLSIQAGPDGSTWYDVTQQNGGSLPWINGTPDPTTDSFDGGTLSNYTSTYQTGGAAATWSVNSGKSLIKATGGTNGILYSNLLQAQNVDALAIMDRADSGGLVLDFVDQSDFYLVQVADAQSSNATPNTISLYKAVGGSPTPLSVYGTSVASTTLPNAGQLAKQTGGTDSGISTKLGTATGWGEVTALGTSAAWASAGSSGAIAPTGKGWLLDSNVLHGQTLQAGNFTFALTSRVTLGTATATMLLRVWAYDTSLGTYTAIGSMTLAGQSLTATKTTYTFAPTAFSAFTFSATQKLYIDCLYNITANSTGSSSAQINMRLSTTGSTGVANDMQLTTQGYVPSGGVSLLGTAPINFIRNTYHIVRASITGGVITVFFDGVQMLSYTDSSPLATGFVGLFNNGGATGSRYYYLWIQPQGDDLTNQVVYTKQILSTSDTTVTPQVQDLTVAAFGPQIDAGTLMPSANYAHTFTDKNMDDLARQSNYEWWCDQNSILYFNAREGLPAPWALQSYNLGLTGSDIEVDNNLQADLSGDQYRNRQVLTNVINSGVFTDTFVGDGARTSFTLRYPVAPGTVPTVVLDSVHQKVGTKGTSGAQWYYADNDPTIAEDSNGPTLTLSDTLSITYTGLFSDTVVVDNTAAQQALALRDNTSGIVEAVEDVSQKKMSYAAAQVYAQALLDRYCVVDSTDAPTGRTLTVGTQRNGLQVGMLLPTYFPEFNFQDALLLIHEIDVSMQTQPGNTVLYYYLLTLSELPKVKEFPALLAENLLR